MSVYDHVEICDNVCKKYQYMLHLPNNITLCVIPVLIELLLLLLLFVGHDVYYGCDDVVIVDVGVTVVVGCGCFVAGWRGGSYVGDGCCGVSCVDVIC